MDIVKYEKKERIAYLTLNRPERLNAINHALPTAIESAVREANEDEEVHVIVLQGAGKAFCSGYDLVEFAEETGAQTYSQSMPWDPTLDYKIMKRNTEQFMSLWKSYKPTICKIHGYAVAGGSDIALCCDLVIMEDDAKIGYPPARLWGCPTTMMWVYRLGAEKAKRMLLTGDLITGKEAEKMGLIYKSCPTDQLDEEVLLLAKRMASVPKNQLMMQKLVINQAYNQMGMETTQMIATIFDGITRHSPEGIRFKEYCEEVGFKQAVKERDSGKNL